MTIKLVQTCDACPEQYDAYLNEEQVGYLRMRHGHFYAACPGYGGEEVYRALPNGDGCFDSEERDLHLTSAALAIQFWVMRRDGSGAPAYEVVERSAV